MNTLRILGHVLSGAALCAAAMACSAGEVASTPTTATTFDILATVGALEAQATLDPASVGTALDATFSVDPEHSDGSFRDEVGTVRADAPAAALIDSIDLRTPGTDNTAAKGPLLSLTLRQGDGPTMDDVLDRFGPATTVDAAADNPQTALILSYQTPRSVLRFGVGTPPTRPLVSVTIDRTG